MEVQEDVWAGTDGLIRYIEILNKKWKRKTDQLELKTLLHFTNHVLDSVDQTLDKLREQRVKYNDMAEGLLAACDLEITEDAVPAHVAYQMGLATVLSELLEQSKCQIETEDLQRQKQELEAQTEKLEAMMRRTKTKDEPAAANELFKSKRANLEQEKYNTTVKLREIRLCQTTHSARMGSLFPLINQIYRQAISVLTLFT